MHPDNPFTRAARVGKASKLIRAFDRFLHDATGHQHSPESKLRMIRTLSVKAWCELADLAAVHPPSEQTIAIVVRHFELEAARCGVMAKMDEWDCLWEPYPGRVYTFARCDGGVDYFGNVISPRYLCEQGDATLRVDTDGSDQFRAWIRVVGRHADALGATPESALNAASEKMRRELLSDTHIVVCALGTLEEEDV